RRKPHGAPDRRVLGEERDAADHLNGVALTARAPTSRADRRAPARCWFSEMTAAIGYATCSGRWPMRPPAGLARHSGGATIRMGADANGGQLAAALVRVAAGDRNALRIIYQDTSAKLFGICLRILRDRSQAEDVLQDVYVTVWRKAATFDPERASPI